MTAKLDNNSHILLLQPLGQLDAPSGYMRTCYIEPFTLECLAAAIEERGFSTEVMTDRILAADICEAVTRTQPLAVCFSAYSYIFSDCLDLARAAKRAATEIGLNLTTVFGGYHPSACPEDTANCPEVDYVVVGEGEETLCELLTTIRNGEIPSDVRGLVFRHNGGLIQTPSRERVQDLDALPLPKRYPEFLCRSHQHQITYPAPSRQVSVAQVSYSRGCPFSCGFCSSENTWGRSVVWRSPVAVLDEIEMLHREHGTNLVYFPDLTLNASRNKLLMLCEEFIARRIPVHWWGLFRLDRLDEEILEALVSAGCVKLSLGIESPEPALAESVKGQYRYLTDASEGLLWKADELGLVLKAFIMVGFPEDTQASLMLYQEQLLRLPLDEIRVTFVTPFPGTEFYNSAVRDGLIPSNPDWSKFTTEEPVLNHPSLRRDDLLNLRRQIVLGFYMSTEYADHAEEKMRRFPRLSLSWIEYFQFLQEKGLFQGHLDEYEALMRRLSSTLNSGSANSEGQLAHTVSGQVLP